MILVSAFSVFLPLYIWPKDVGNEIDAVMYTEGDNSVYTEVFVDIDGHFNRRLFGGTKFTGKIRFEGTGFREDYYSQNVSIKFDSDGIGILRYLDESGQTLKLVQKGYICMPMDVSYIVVSWGDIEDINEHDVRGSTIVAGPVQDINSAVSLTGEKFRKLLD